MAVANTQRRVATVIGAALLQGHYGGDWRAYWAWLGSRPLSDRTRADLQRGVTHQTNDLHPAWLWWTLAVGGRAALEQARAGGHEAALRAYLDAVLDGPAERHLLSLPPRHAAPTLASPHTPMPKLRRSTLAALDLQIQELQSQARAAEAEADRLLGGALRRALTRLDDDGRATVMETLDRVVTRRADRVALGLEVRRTDHRTTEGPTEPAELQPASHPSRPRPTQARAPEDTRPRGSSARPVASLTEAPTGRRLAGAAALPTDSTLDLDI